MPSCSTSESLAATGHEPDGAGFAQDGIQDGTLMLCDTLKPVEKRYITANNNCKLLYRRFRRRDLASKCIVLLIHGFGEHIGRFHHVIEMLIDSACDVHTIDLRGHGLSGGPRADGYFSDFVSDISLLHRVAHTASPSLPVFLYGQSMGGMLVMAYAIRRSRLTRCNIRGVIATSPWFRLSKGVQPSWWKVKLLELASPMLQEFLVSSNVDPCSLTNEEHVVNAAINDRLVLPFMTVRMARQILCGARDTLAIAEQMQVPFLLCHAVNDSLTDASASTEFGQRASSKDKTVRIFRARGHEIHNDRDRQQLFDEIRCWVDQRCTMMPPQRAAALCSQLHYCNHAIRWYLRRIFSALLLLYLLLVWRSRQSGVSAWLSPLLALWARCRQR